MDIVPKAVTRVIESFEKLPGIGPKTAQRLAFYMLHMPVEEVERFSRHLMDLKKGTVLCGLCKNVSESDPCAICRNPARDHSLICVVEQATDVLALEKTGAFHGVYHVLHGLIDPLNNIGPDEIYMEPLINRIAHADAPIRELVFALNSTMESEATIMYAKKHLTEKLAGQGGGNGTATGPTLTRLAHGLPIGADIEYADEVTLKRAMEGRREY